ncbi:MAG TPA: pilus assembly protein TadG-related protein, partial [Dongiaceae bacterium]
MKKSLWKSLASSESGAVAPLVGFCIIMLVGAVGVAVDVGRAQVTQSKLQAALDSAGLAAGAVVGQNLTEEALKPEARKYLDANFLGKTVDATICNDCFDLDLSDDQSIVTLEATATLPTTFMRIFGKESIQVAAQTEITRETTGLEVALVLDTTGSMDDAVGGSPFDSTKKIAALRTAGNDLVNILFGNHATVDDLWVGVVPFSQSVNVGTAHSDWMSDLTTYTNQIYCAGPTSGTPSCPNDSTHLSNSPVSTRTNPITRVNQYMFASKAGWYFSPHSWSGCVLERWTNSRDVTDDTPSTQKWQTYFVPDTSGSGNNDWRNGSNGNMQVNTTNDVSANKGCPTTPVTTLTNTKQTVLDAINALTTPRGNTHVNVGAVWGWRLLSPKWRGLWGGQMDGNSLPLDYDEPLSQKAMVLMTDGENTMSSNIYTAYGFESDGHLGTTSSDSVAEATLNTKTATICNSMKAKGVLIYTIVFGNGSSTTAKNMMKNCASEADFYFDSPSQAALQNAFRAIGDSLSKLRVSR